MFLSAKGWQPGGALPDDASLLALNRGQSAAATSPPADELPASLLRGGVLQLHAFTAKRVQARPPTAVWWLHLQQQLQCMP